MDDKLADHVRKALADAKPLHVETRPPKKPKKAAKRKTKRQPA